MKENIFHKIESPNQAYWLGFLAADGSVSGIQLVIGLSTKDIDHLEKFRAFVDANNLTITTRQTLCANNNKRYSASYFCIKNEQLIQDLSHYGIVKDKSHQDIDFLSYIPEEYKIYFIFGLFDGDGWFTNTERSGQNFGICGNKKVIESVYAYLYKYFNWIHQVQIRQETHSTITYRFAITRQSYCLDFIKNYCKAAEKCDILTRKLQTAKEIKEILETKTTKKKKAITDETVHYLVNKTCPICNKEFFGKTEQIYCSQICAHIAQQKTQRPSREELKKRIRKKSFLALGQQFGVSDNAIRKWCKAMNLPSTKKEINSYSDEAWDLI